jgi:regulator of replication initiation timing
MTQKSPKNTSVSDLLQTIDPKGIADESMRHTVEMLLNFLEELSLRVKSLEEENQRLRDENNRSIGRTGQARDQSQEYQRLHKKSLI